jgi:hypothetical protein
MTVKESQYQTSKYTLSQTNKKENSTTLAQKQTQRTKNYIEVTDRKPDSYSHLLTKS